MQLNIKVIFAAIFATALLASLSGCVSMKEMNSFERKASVCAGTILGGALLGKLVDDEDGTATGAVVGGVACALFALLDPYDKERIRTGHKQALDEQKPVSDSWEGKDGKSRNLEVSAPQPVQVASHEEKICRQIGTTLAIDGAGENQASDIYCMSPEGDWFPVTV